MQVMKDVLVTGGTGYIGSHTVRERLNMDEIVKSALSLSLKLLVVYR